MTMRKKIRLSADDQLRIWKAAIVLMDGRSVYARTLKRAVEMIEERDRLVDTLSKEIEYMIDEHRAVLERRA